MTVVARCSNCLDEHELAARKLTDESTTTLCPNCQAKSYTTEAQGEAEKSATSQLEDKLLDIDGVGGGIVQEIKRRRLSIYDLSQMDEAELQGIAGVGKKTAENIKNSL